MQIRSVVIDDSKLKKMLEEKNEMIILGRNVSQDIEDIETEMSQIDAQIKDLESKVDISDLDKEAQALTDEANAWMEKMNGVQKKVFERLKAAIPSDLNDKYAQKIKEKEAKENERNKIALKVQKWKDKIIPLTQKISKPLLADEFEDFSEITLENGEATLKIFNHLEEWKENFNKKRLQRS